MSDTRPTAYLGESDVWYLKTRLRVRLVAWFIQTFIIVGYPILMLIAAEQGYGVFSTLWNDMKLVHRDYINAAKPMWEKFNIEAGKNPDGSGNVWSDGRDLEL